MNLVSGILGVITAPLVTAYGEYRKWQLADRVADETRRAVGDALDRARVYYGPKVEGHLNQLAVYGKLTIISVGSYGISSIAMLPRLLGGCFLQEPPSLSCRAVDYIAAAASCYSLFSICVLGGKGFLDAYQYCKGAEKTGSVRGSNQAIDEDRLKKQKDVIEASIKLEVAHRRRLIYDYEKLEKLAKECLSQPSFDFGGALCRAFRGFDPALYPPTTPYDEGIDLLRNELYRSRIKIEALEDQLKDLNRV